MIEWSDRDEPYTVLSMEQDIFASTINLLLPSVAGLRFVTLELGDASAQITIFVASTQPTSECPLCHQPATRTHSRYARTLLDLPGLLSLSSSRSTFAASSAPTQLAAAGFSLSACLLLLLPGLAAPSASPIIIVPLVSLWVVPPVPASPLSSSSRPVATHFSVLSAAFRSGRSPRLSILVSMILPFARAEPMAPSWSILIGTVRLTSCLSARPRHCVPGSSSILVLK